MTQKNRNKKKAKLKNTDSQLRSSDIQPHPASNRFSSTRRSFLLTNWKQVSIISLLALGLYVQSVSFNYVLDDLMMIVDNKFTQQGVNGIDDIFSNDSFRGALGDQKTMLEGGRYRPLSIATFALEQSITGGSKAVSHAINVLLYILTGILLYRVLLFMFPKAKSALPQKKWFFTVPFVAAILFIAHPLHVEVVANIKGRDELIALLGEAGALYFTFKYIGEKKLKYLVLSFFSFFMGILSKESVITFLAIIPLTVHFFTNTRLSDKIKVMIPAIAATFLYLVIRVYALGDINNTTEITDLMNNPFYNMTFGEKTATIFYTLLLYLKLHIFPHPLTHDYYPFHIPKMNWSNWPSILSLLLYTGLLIIIWRGWKKKTVWAYSITFFLIALSIVSNLFISVGTFMNERFVYQASLGFCIAAAWLLVEKMSYTSLLKKVSIVVFILGTILLSAKTLTRLPDWKSQTTLDRAGLKYSPNSARANYLYSYSLWKDVYSKLPPGIDSARRKAILDSISPYCEKALQILPNYGPANSIWAGLAVEYYKLDQNYEALLRAFEKVNFTGAYEKFILEYLLFVNKRVNDRKNSGLLAAFYSRMIDYYDRNFKNTTLPSFYRALLKELQERMVNMQ